jgi:hypothetical protein
VLGSGWMFRLLRLAISLVVLAGFVWFGVTVPLGSRTLFEHVARIWRAPETQELVEGARGSAGPTLDRLKRGVQAGVEEASKAPPTDGGARDGGAGE